jgi:succinate dehydrogenase / fumarate reductase cytochrome b subunit
VLLTWWLVAAAASDRAFAAVQWFLASWVGIICLLGWSASLVFHLFSGVRHLAWDAGYGFEKPTYNRTGWTVVIATVAVGLVVWIVGFAVW